MTGFILGLIAVFGFGIVGWFLADTRKRVRIIFGAGSASARDFEQNLAVRVARSETTLEEMGPRLTRTEDAARVSVQKVGFLRFNPFQDTGGDNSFVIALLDGKDNGIVLSSLYMREGTRLYAKQITRGAAKQPLSDEEQKVLDETINESPKLQIPRLPFGGQANPK